MPQNSLFRSKLPEKIKQVLSSLSVGYENVDTIDLNRSINDHLSSLNAALKYNEFIDIATAQRLVEVFEIVFENYHQYDDREKSYIIGAARYFVRENDERPDSQSILGLDDDVQVVNYVLDIIGRSDLKVDI